MDTKLLHSFLYIFCCFITLSAQDSTDSKLKIWFDQPADATMKDDPNGWTDDQHWLSALPLGNGSLGAMVFGDVHQERIQLNEESMWSGSPDDNDNPKAFEAQSQIRQLLFDGKYKEATALTNETQICQGAGSGHGNGAGVPFGCFQTLGDLRIDFDSKEPFSEYQRNLDLSTATANVSYIQNGVRFKRSYFISEPDQVMAIRFTADRPGMISFQVSLDRPERFEIETSEDELVMKGSLSDGKGGNGLQYMTRLGADHVNGRLEFNKGQLEVVDADEAVIYLSASTNYVMDYPEYKGRAYIDHTKKHLKTALEKGFQNIYTDHLKEYQEYFGRVKLDLGQDEKSQQPTDIRLQNYMETKSDNGLEALMFQYGRYLLISSSRPGTLPANLQGIWANKIQTPWNGDYHTDVNVEMNYWLAETTNLSEMHLPLFDLINSLVEPGKRTARIQYHLDGWVIHPITNVWGYTSPGERASWGLHSGGGAWITSHIMEHYRFTKDTAFLEKMFPALEESVKFYLGWLVEEPETGLLVSGPAVSPENTFIAPDGSKSQISMGPAHDQQVIWQLFTDYINAADILGKTSNLGGKVMVNLAKLAGNKIGSDGRLMEWREEFEEVEPGHRHISHLFAVHPGAQINTIETPELAAAAKKSLDFRIANGGGHTGWSAAWLISQYARLGEGNKAKAALETVLSKSTATNLFGLHPPFQMDANFGTSAGIAEMLLQSHAGVIELLPALPNAWSEGSVEGLRARGGLTVKMTWQDGTLKEASIKSDHEQRVTVVYNGISKDFLCEKGEITLLDF